MRKRARIFSPFAAVAVFTMILDAFAQGYPTRPIRMLVGYGAGGGTDVAARMVAQKLSDNLAQPVVVENLTGAAATIAAARVASSPADGHTLLMMAAADAAQPALRKLPYDLERDLAPVSLVVNGPAYVLVVHPSMPARNVKELIALARSKPGQLNYASSGIGSQAHLAGELFRSMAKVNIVQVPYRIVMEAVVAVVAGEVAMGFPSIPALLPFLKTAKLRPLAVTSAKRAPVMPSIPTLDESGFRGYDRSGWYGVLGPAAVPEAIIAQLNAAIAKVVNTPDMRQAFSKQGLEAHTNTPEQFAALIRTEVVQSAKLIKSAGVKPE